MKCSNCGYDNDSGSLFCANCGKKIEIIKGFYNINLIMSPSEIIPTNLPFSTTGN